MHVERCFHRICLHLSKHLQQNTCAVIPGTQAQRNTTISNVTLLFHKAKQQGKFKKLVHKCIEENSQNMSQKR